MVKVELYKLHPDVPVPSYGTSMSACFDLSFFATDPIVNGYDRNNNPVEVYINEGVLCIMPGERLLVPTGLIAKVERTDASIRLHPRSGLSLKRGLILANCEGVIDADYQQQIYVMMTNISTVPQAIKQGERICQGEVVISSPVEFQITDKVPMPHSERSGGFGSTGT